VLRIGVLEILDSDFGDWMHALIALGPHDTADHECKDQCHTDFDKHTGSELTCSHDACVAWRARMNIGQ